jgi:predicted ATP-grasp superfamily ATP-dependent carboligase
MATVTNSSSHLSASASGGSKRSGDLSGISVLVTDEHYKHTLGLVRHLGKKGAKVSILAVSPSSLACSTRYVTQVLPLAGRDEISFISSALEAVTNNYFDLFIPVSYLQTLALARHIEIFRPHVKVELAGAPLIERAANKACMSKLAASIGVPVPQSFVPVNMDEVKELAGKLSYPVVVKAQRESPGRSVSYAHNAADLHSCCSHFFSQTSDGSDPPLLQEFIPGYGCGFFTIYQRGVCKRVFMHRRVREYPASGGVSTCAQSFYHPKLELYGKKLLDALAWHGVAMVEFRHDSRDGEFKLIEVNPKLWGSLDLALAAGADFPGDLCRMALNKNLEFSGAYDGNLRFHWPLSISGELYHLKSRPASLFEVALDSLNPWVKSNVWPTDPQPNLSELISLARFLLSPKSRRGQ